MLIPCVPLLNNFLGPGLELYVLRRETTTPCVESQLYCAKHTTPLEVWRPHASRVPRFALAIRESAVKETTSYLVSTVAAERVSFLLWDDAPVLNPRPITHSVNHTLDTHSVNHTLVHAPSVQPDPHLRRR